MPDLVDSQLSISRHSSKQFNNRQSRKHNHTKRDDEIITKSVEKKETTFGVVEEPECTTTRTVRFCSTAHHTLKKEIDACSPRELASRDFYCSSCSSSSSDDDEDDDFSYYSMSKSCQQNKRERLAYVDTISKQSNFNQKFQSFPTSTQKRRRSKTGNNCIVS